MYLTIKHGIHKFSSNLKSHVSNITIDDDFSSCLVGICVDSFDNIYVTDGGNNGSEKPILMLSAEGKLLARFGNRRHRLHGIAINKTGDLFVCLLCCRRSIGLQSLAHATSIYYYRQ